MPAGVQAQFTFVTNTDNTITITGCTGPNGVMVILSATNGYPVTSIGPNAFFGCAHLTNVVFPASVTRIAEFAFGSCTSLTGITFPRRLASIGDDAFNSCFGLTNVAIPASVTSIGDYAFFYCTNLTAIAVNRANPKYGGADGVLFNKDQTTLMQFPFAKAGRYTIPASVTSIADEAFGLDDQGDPGVYYNYSACPGLTNLVIPRHVRIGCEAFAYCPNLASVTLSNGLTSIGDEAFYDSGLRQVTIPGSVRNLGAGAFAACRRLAGVTLQNGVASIAESGFDFCTNLDSISLPNSLTSIGETAFWFCTRLPNVTIPPNVTNIGLYAFSACARLQNISVDANNPSYRSENGILYDKHQTTLIQFPGGKGGIFTIPDGVRSIGDYAFANYDPSFESYYYLASCAGLTDIIFPRSISGIREEAFWNLNGLAGLCFEGNAPGDTGDLVDGFDFATIYDLPGTTGWDTTFAEVPTTPWLLPTPKILEFEPDFGVQANSFCFTISWATNVSVVVEASTNLVHWQPVQTNTLSSGLAFFSDPHWTNHARRFYRLRSR